MKEQVITQKQIELSRQARLDANEQIIRTNEQRLADLIQQSLGAEVVGHMYDLDALDDYLIWIVLLDTKFTIAEE